jgi:hypothetical protein
MIHSLEGPLERSSKRQPNYTDDIHEVLNSETDVRQSSYIRARFQLVRLAFLKAFQQFDFAVQPSTDEPQIRERRTLWFVHEASNFNLRRPPGAGKTLQCGHKPRSKTALWDFGTPEGRGSGVCHTHNEVRVCGCPV